MFHVTDRAKEVLFQKKQAHLPQPDMMLRLASRGGRLALVADRVKAGDRIITHGDAPVLLVDPQMSEIVLAGTIVDCRDTADGSIEFVLTKVRRSPRDAASEPR
jgi:hypothetical protein